MGRPGPEKITSGSLCRSRSPSVILSSVGG